MNTLMELDGWVSIIAFGLLGVGVLLGSAIAAIVRRIRA